MHITNEPEHLSVGDIWPWSLTLMLNFITCISCLRVLGGTWPSVLVSSVLVSLAATVVLFVCTRLLASSDGDGIDIDQVCHSRVWTCPECGRTIEHSYEALAEVGMPICEDCDCEMELG